MQTQTTTHSHHSEEGMPRNKKGSTSPSVLSLFILGVTAVVALGGVFLSWQRYALQKTNAEITQKIETKIKTIQGLSKGTDSVAYQTAAQVLSKAQNYRVEWSSVAQKILALESPRVKFSQFSSSPKKEISIQGTANSMEDIARLLMQLKKNPEIKNPFVSSVAEQGEGSLFSFQLTFQLSSAS